MNPQVARINFVRTVAENGGGFYGYQVSVPRGAQNNNDVFKMSFDNIELLQQGPRQSSRFKVNSDHEKEQIDKMRQIKQLLSINLKRRLLMLEG